MSYSVMEHQVFALPSVAFGGRGSQCLLVCLASKEQQAEKQHFLLLLLSGCSWTAAVCLCYRTYPFLQQVLERWHGRGKGGGMREVG